MHGPFEGIFCQVIIHLYIFLPYAVTAFKGSHSFSFPGQSQRKMQLSSLSDSLAKSSHCLGADVLMKLLANYCRNDQMRTSIRVGVVGKLTEMKKSSLFFFCCFDEENVCV